MLVFSTKSHLVDNYRHILSSFLTSMAQRKWTRFIILARLVHRDRIASRLVAWIFQWHVRCRSQSKDNLLDIQWHRQFSIGYARSRNGHAAVYTGSFLSVTFVPTVAINTSHVYRVETGCVWTADHEWPVRPRAGYVSIWCRHRFFLAPFP